MAAPYGASVLNSVHKQVHAASIIVVAIVFSAIFVA